MVTNTLATAVYVNCGKVYIANYKDCNKAPTKVEAAAAAKSAAKPDRRVSEKISFAGLTKR